MTEEVGLDAKTCRLAASGAEIRGIRRLGSHLSTQKRQDGEGGGLAVSPHPPTRSPPTLFDTSPRRRCSWSKWSVGVKKNTGIGFLQQPVTSRVNGALSFLPRLKPLRTPRFLSLRTFLS
ncbi:hypothetical protein EYF80_024690 [Liparis tanakae]|uniref:Uncharacterized protein n=1 Tax=Liparis tanakae TaxID=230148 RepID=A0A4Z2HHJ4_9TELE|nr:hypothetical protein EYF80_024690 [Liparis tanakae]